MTDLRERVARGLYSARPDYSVHTEEYPGEETKAWDAVPVDWQDAYRLLADTALRLITEECAKVAEADACLVYGTEIARRIRQLAGDK